jgi:hypothetical protein
MRYNDGSYYEGEFKDNLKDGKGVFYDKNGNKTSGVFKSDVLVYNDEMLISNFIATENSNLYVTPEKVKVFVRIDFIGKPDDVNVSAVIRQLKSNIPASGRLNLIYNTDSYSDEVLGYIIMCSDIKITFEGATCKDNQGREFKGYNCNISLNLLIRNNKGISINHQTVTSTSNILFAPCYTTTAEAFKAAKDNININSFIKTNVPTITVITGIEKTDKSGAAKSVFVEGGSNIGLTQPGPFNTYIQEFDVYEETNKVVIGKLKVRNVDNQTSIFSVVEGGIIIADKISKGYKLVIVSK